MGLARCLIDYVTPRCLRWSSGARQDSHEPATIQSHCPLYSALRNCGNQHRQNGFIMVCLVFSRLFLLWNVSLLPSVMVLKGFSLSTVLVTS